MIRLWRIFWRSAQLEWREILSRPLDQVLLLWMPAIAVGLVWYTFSISQVNDLPIGVLNQDNSSVSRKLERMVDASPNVSIVTHYQDAAEMARALKQVDVYAVLVIPKDFSRSIRRFTPSPVVLKVNAQYGTHSGIIQSGVSGAVRTFSAGVELSMRKKMGFPQAREGLMPIQPVPKMAFNLSLSYQLFLASGVIPALLQVLATVIGVGAIGREIRQKTIQKWFDEAQKRNKSQTNAFLAILMALLGKLFFQMIAFSVWSILTLILIVEQNQITMSSLYITIFNAWLMTLISLWLGIILTTASMSKRIGLSLSGIITAPAFSYSGVTFPIAAMPEGAQIISAILPLTHYLKIQISQIQAQADWHQALPTTYGFIFTVIVMATIASLLTLSAMRKQNVGIKE